MSGPAPRQPLAVALSLALAAAAGLPGCKQSQKSLCQGDVQCAPGFSCDPATGRCGCESDSSCNQGEGCNLAGFCQPKLRCDSSADCGDGTFCDSPSGKCIARESCTLDVQCKVAEVCELSSFSCVPGCRQTGDCLLSEVCRACPQGTPGAQCPVGKRCVQGRCDRQSSCRYGEFCLPPAGVPVTDCSAATADCTCQRTTDPYCASCSSRPADPKGSCDGTESYCLIDTSQPLGQSFFCGVNCAEGQACPNGYACRDIRIVTYSKCTLADGLSSCKAPAANPPCDPAKNHAPANGKPGVVNDDCEALQPPLVGSVCDPATSRCSAQCLGTGETSLYGFCSCVQDSDCPQDACSASTRTCQISGKPCFLGASPDECQSTHQIFCVKATDARLGDVGYCRIGQNCAPAPGYTCAVLRTGTP